ncbi:hypothetical protein OSB04_000736 [Centaurea solstitialis]|uniref:Uncharacterized protein n=1 Tax=Centaurea solstitialis TaxID=347529 RepID=A0AA38WS95_9ASTR|nr:hypothetical protein OSB04_000736 [Centaurea solstitialis]
MGNPHSFTKMGNFHRVIMRLKNLCYMAHGELIIHHLHVWLKVCNHSRAIKYLFKYIHKGLDRAKSKVESSVGNVKIDESCWHIF